MDESVQEAASGPPISNPRAYYVVVGQCRIGYILP